MVAVNLLRPGLSAPSANPVVLWGASVATVKSKPDRVTYKLGDRRLLFQPMRREKLSQPDSKQRRNALKTLLWFF